MAIAAFPSEKHPAQNRDVVVSLDRCLATRATGSWGDDGNPFRNAGDAYIQEAPYDATEEEEQERDHTIDFATGTKTAQCAETLTCRMLNGKKLAVSLTTTDFLGYRSSALN
jgi:hypothetical protein